MNIIRIFIAGSKSLKEERLRMKALVNDMNSNYSGKGKPVTINMSSYEDFGDRQIEYDEFIKEEADIVIFIIDKKLGKKTENEFKIACQSYREKGKPEVISFFHSFPERTPDIEHAESVIYKESGKYYVDYNNYEDLIAKAKERIDTYVTKSIREKILHHTRKKMNWILKLSLILFALMVCLAFLIPFCSSNRLVLYVSDPPVSLSETGINKNFIEKQMAEALPDINNETYTKVNDILSRFSSESNIKHDWLSNTGINDINPISYTNQFVRSIRRLIGKKDLFVSIKIVETDSSYIGRVFIEDWKEQCQTKTIEEPKSAYENVQKCALSLIKKSAWFSVNTYSPVASVLFDYDLSNGIDDYNISNQWNDRLFKDSERLELLQKAIDEGSPDSSYCRLIMGHYYEYMGNKHSDALYIYKACENYKAFANSNLQFQSAIQERINLLEQLTSSKKTISIPEKLIQIGVINTDSIDQIVIVSNQEKRGIQGMDYYKAFLSAYEKHNNRWIEAPIQCEVNIGVNGIAKLNEKKEGDKTTPSGFYPLPFVFGKDRDIKTKMEFRILNKTHVWVCDTLNPNYNQWIEDTSGQYWNNPNYEHLLSIYPQYKYAIVVGYNIDPIIKGKGSAIFMHVQPETNRRTIGCISMPEKTIIHLIEWLDPAKNPHIYISQRIDNL